MRFESREGFVAVLESDLLAIALVLLGPRRALDLFLFFSFRTNLDNHRYPDLRIVARFATPNEPASHNGCRQSRERLVCRKIGNFGNSICLWNWLRRCASLRKNAMPRPMSKNGATMPLWVFCNEQGRLTRCRQPYETGFLKCRESRPDCEEFASTTSGIPSLRCFSNKGKVLST
jgi:hypothetical protein